MTDRLSFSSIEPPAGARAAVSSLKEVVSVIMALTMTNTLVLLLTGGNYAEVRDLSGLPPEEIMFASLLIITIFRFYHGNVRHLDAVYCGERDDEHVVKPAPRGGLGVDFAVILTQSLLLGVMSFYASDPHQLLLLFVILLASDVAWALVVQQPTADRSVFKHQRNWLLSNFFAGAVIIVIFAIVGGTEHSDFLSAGGGVVMLGSAIGDFAINWSFYFPDRRNQSQERAVFLAAPLTQTIDPETNQVSGEYRGWLEGLIGALEGAGHGVVSAHEREGWGEQLDSPTAALRADLENLRNSAAVVAHVGVPPSPGVQFELGVATSLGLPILLVLDKDEPHPYLTSALPAVSSAEILEVDQQDGSHGRIVEALSKLLDEFDG